MSKNSMLGSHSVLFVLFVVIVAVWFLLVYPKETTNYVMKAPAVIQPADKCPGQLLSSVITGTYDPFKEATCVPLAPK